MPTRLPAVFLAACVALACGAGQAAAATFTVDRTASDAIDNNVGDGVCATQGGGCTLRAAVQEANLTTAADTIVLPSGQTAQLSIGPAGTATPATGDLDVTHDLVVRASGATAATIEANDVDRIFDTGSGVDLTISHLTLMDGHVSANSGGAILNAGTLSVNDSRLTSNDAVKNGGVDGMGGAIASGGAGSKVTILRSRIDGNTASEGGALSIAGTTTVDSSTLDNNSSRTGESGSGGAIQNLGTLGIVNSTLSGNHDNGGNGGGALVNSGQGQVTIMYSTIADNTGGTGSAFRDIGGVGSFVHVAASIVLGDCNANHLTSVAPHHNIGGGATCGLADADDAPNAMPNLDPLADNGGATVTRKLEPVAGVDGIDDIPAASCGSVVDQRGGKRPVGGACDVGAYEVNALADLTLTGSVAGDPVTAGDTITYSYEVAAHGPDAATGVVLSDPLPAGVSFVSGSAGCGEAAGTVTCAVGAVPIGTPASVAIVLRADAANPALANTATLAADQNDPTPEALTLTSVVAAAPTPPDGWWRWRRRIGRGRWWRRRPARARDDDLQGEDGQVRHEEGRRPDVHAHARRDRDVHRDRPGDEEARLHAARARSASATRSRRTRRPARSARRARRATTSSTSTAS